MEYNFSEIEAKWQKYWDETKIFQTKEEALKKFYLLVMFAYPSGDIHILEIIQLLMSMEERK